MNKNIDVHIDEKEYATGESSGGDETMRMVLPELEASQQILDQIRRNIDVQQNSVSKSLYETENVKFLTAIESMTEGVIIISEEGVVEIANPIARKLLGLAESSSLTEVKTTMENLGLQQLFTAKRHAATKYAREFIGKAATGKILQMKWNPIIGGDRRPIGNVIIICDITAQTELDRTQTEFIAAVSHELRTPLTTIQNSVSNMLAGVTGKIAPKMNQYLNTMQADCHRLARLINDLLDMAKLEAGKMPINRSVTNLAEVAAKVVRAFSSSAAEKGLRLELVTEGRISRVYVDSQRIYQVFSNIITNAIKYTDKGGSILISLFECKNEVEAVVTDTGIGIAPEHQRHIFNKFYQISRQTGPGYNGSGLGLALSREIVAAHDGKMWVESELGKGSVFHFSLPKSLPQIVLRKHLETLIEHAHKKGEHFAMMVVRLAASRDYAEQNKPLLEGAMKRLLHMGEEIATASGDLIIRRGELETVIILSQTGKRYLAHVKRRLHNAIGDTLMEGRCYDSVVPMVGIALYPNDASTVEELEHKVTTELNRLI
jgi:signal transduction histidine kinase